MEGWAGDKEKYESAVGAIDRTRVIFRRQALVR